jgi:hypothetical protein
VSCPTAAARASPDSCAGGPDEATSKLETPMILRFWESIGGTLILEFQVVPRSPGVGRRLVDAVILPAGPKQVAQWSGLERVEH